MGYFHKRKCICNHCYIMKKLLKNRQSDENAIIHLQNILKNMVINNLNFRPQSRGRFVNKRKILKIFREEEVIQIFPHVYQLVSCRRCKKLGKATLKTKRLCLHCASLTHKYNENIHWDMWANSV